MANITSQTREAHPGEDAECTLILEAQRNPSAFTAIYCQHVERVYYYLFARVADRPVAEDLTAQVFLDALEGLPRYHHRGHFLAWLFTIARHRLADHYRRLKPELPLDDVQLTAVPVSALLAQVIQSERLQTLSHLLERLDEDERELLRLRFAAGLTFVEMAEVLGRKEPAVKMSCHRLLARLHSQMEAEHA